jgi:uncharacterized protein YfaS (alpha-2-macroglobulin family)
MYKTDEVEEVSDSPAAFDQESSSTAAFDFMGYVDERMFR